MEKEKVAMLNDYKKRIDELKAHKRLFEGSKIKSVIVRKFDHDAITFQDVEVPVFPRGKVKSLLINRIEEDIKHFEEKIAAL